MAERVEDVWRPKTSPWLIAVVMAKAIPADTFPLEKRGLAFAVFGITAVTAPAIGPTLGAWVTDNDNMRPAQPAKIKLDTYGREDDGHVDSIAAAVQRIAARERHGQLRESGSQDRAHLLRPGLSVVPTVRIR